MSPNPTVKPQFWEYRPFTKAEEQRRKRFRRELLVEAVDEEPGDVGASSHQLYVRESCWGGVTIQMRRPASFNYGVDFTYRVCGLAGHTANWQPSLAYVFEDIGGKIEERRTVAPLLFQAIDAVYRSADPTAVLADVRFQPLVRLKSGIPFDVLLKLLKWVFLEQDLTYWHFTGRRKPMEGVRRQFSERFGPSNVA